MRCTVICVDGTHGPIELPDGEPVILGRSPITGITDSKVSRQHIQFTANYADRTVEVKQLGTNPCFIEGKSLIKNGVVVLSCDVDSKLNFLEDKYPHSLQFKKEEIKQDEKKTISDLFRPNVRKRKSENSLPDNDSKRIKAIEESKQLDEDGGSESDDENQKRVHEQLRVMRENFKKTEANVPKAQAKSQNTFKENRRKEKPPAMTGNPTVNSKWEEHGKLLMYTSLGVLASHKIAAFDIDSTIICTQSGKVFATHAGDWKIMLSEIPGKLKKLRAEGYKIVFFTNQNGIQRGKVKVPEYKTKIENIISKLGVPVQVFVSTGHGPFRKPGLGMWNFLCQQRNDGIEVDIDESIYVGDAAGRPAGWAPGKKKDFSTSDRLFALNAGLKFYTPEEYFLGHRKAPFNMPEFDPRNLPQKQLPEKIASKNQEVIVCVGFPASGKSFFAKKHLVPKGYVHVNRDTLKTWQKCVEATKNALRDGRSVVVDNTNPDPESRKRYIDCAKQAEVDCRCFVFTTSLTQCRHNERFRETTDKSHEPINDMIMNSFKSKFVDAKVSEGFNEIVKIDFVPHFINEDQEKFYKQFLLEK